MSSGRNSLLAVFIGMLAVCMLASPVMAHDPYSHIYLDDLACADTAAVAASSRLQIACQNKAYFDAGNIATDITVPKYVGDYLFHTGNGYSATHGWAFQSCLMTEASKQAEPKYMALALGNAAHQLQDSILHNNQIPNVILSTEVPNIPIHPVWEASELGVTSKADSVIAARASVIMVPLINNPSTGQPNDPIAQNMWKTCVGQQAALQGFDTMAALNFLNGALASPDGWFTQVFALPSVYQQMAFGDFTSGALAIAVALVFGFVLWHFDHKIIGTAVFIFFLVGGLFMLNGGLYGVADKSTVATMQSLSLQRMEDVFKPQNWDCPTAGVGRCQFDSTGFSNLRSADDQIMIVWYIIGGVMIALVALLGYKWVKDR